MKKLSGKKQKKKMMKAANKAPSWLRTGAAAGYDPHGDRAFKNQQMGLHRPPSEVRRIDPQEYLKEKALKQGSGGEE